MERKFDYGKKFYFEKKSILKTNFNLKKNWLWKKIDFVKKLVFNCNYPAVSQHIHHLFLFLHQVLKGKQYIPLRWKTEFLQPRSRKSLISMHIGSKWYEIDAKSTWSFACPLACLLARLTHLLAPHCSCALLRFFVPNGFKPRVL